MSSRRAPQLRSFDHRCFRDEPVRATSAVCGLPLGSTRQLKPAAMVNLLGDAWERGEPKWENALKDSNVKLHLYGKSEPRLRPKMGHLTALGATVDHRRNARRSTRANG